MVKSEESLVPNCFFSIVCDFRYGSVEGQGHKVYTLTNFLVNIT